MPRRALAPAVLGAAALTGALTGCGPSPVPTSADVAKDPLASLDPEVWNARSAEELLALPVHGDVGDLDTWEELGGDDAVLDPVRAEVVEYLRVSYLDLEALRELDGAETLERILAVAPETWQEDLEQGWNAENRHFFAFTLAEPFRTVGRPAMCAAWYRSEDLAVPQLALGLTMARTVIDARTRDVGVIASRLGLLLKLDPTEAWLSHGEIAVTLHGMDGCAITEADGLLVPAISSRDSHQAAQKATWDLVLDEPAIPLQDVKDPASALFAGDSETFLDCE